MEYKLKNEVKALQKIGLPEELAILAAGIKLGCEDVVNSVLNELYDEQSELEKMVSMLQPFQNTLLEKVEQNSASQPSENIFKNINPITNEATSFVTN